MRNKFAVVVIASLLNTSSFATASQFTGFYAGVNSGWTNTDINNKQTLTINSATIEDINEIINSNKRIYATSARENSNGVTGGLNIGYARLIYEKYIIALEARANLQDLKITFDDERRVLDQTNETTNEVRFNNQVELNNDFSFLVKVGVSPLSMSKILFYGLIGPGFGNFQTSEKFLFVSNEQNLSKNDSHSVYVTGIVAGIGMEYQIYSHVNLALEFTHTDYGKIGINDLNQSLTTQIQPNINLLTSINFDNNVNARANNFTLRINYYF